MMDRPRHTAITGVSTVRLANGPRAALDTVARGAQGVLFRVLPVGDEGETAFEVALVFGESDPEIQLRYTADDASIIAEWRTLAAALGQTLLLEMPDGVVVEVHAQLGLVRVGVGHDRRRCAAITKRRPRFLCRRKASRMPERPVMVRGVDFQTWN